MKRLPKFLALVGAMMTAASAQALPTIVTDWNYSISTTWTAATSENPATLSGVDTKQLSWGTPSPLNGNGEKSKLTIGPDPDPSGSVTTFIGPLPGAIANPAFWAPGNVLTHSNNIIRRGESLLTATLTSTLTLEAALPVSTPGLPGDLLPLKIDIKFKETPNAAPCVVSPYETECPDIFTLVSALAPTTFFYDVDGSGPQQYFLSVFPSSGGVLTQLPAAVCAAAGDPPGCIGFTTEEKKETSLAFSFVISTQQPIPEPASLAMVGLGLLGAGLARRRALRKA